jgi:hypothetical protein
MMAEIDFARVKRNVSRMIDQDAPDEDIDAYLNDEGTTADALKAHTAQLRTAQTPDVAVDAVKGLGYGFNEGVDATLNMIGAPVRAPVNWAAEKLGFDFRIPELQLARRANVAGPAETTAGRTAQAVGEVAGSSVLPTAGMAARARQLGPAATGILSSYAQAPARAAAADAASATGAGLGVAVARENDLGPVAELGLGLAGGYAAPNAANLAARSYGGLKAAKDYAGRQVERARDPETAAYRDIAEQMGRAGVAPDDVRGAISPPRSRNLEARGFTAEDLSDIISRQLAGENADDIVQDYARLVDAQGRSLTGDTARTYLRRYEEANPTAMNIIDVAKDLRGTGNAIPLSNQARADMAIADDPVAAQRLIQRQREQPGRVADIIEQSRVDGRNLEEELTRLATTAKAEEQAAYAEVHRQARPIEIQGVIRAARGVASQRAGEIGRKLNEAVDLFFEPEIRQSRRLSPMTRYRMKEALNRRDEAWARGDQDAGIKHQLRYNAMREQDDYARPLKEFKLGTPIKDVRRFIDARQELDQMIAMSIKDHKPTPLTEVLTRFRTELNGAARRTNSALREADARFHDNRATERLIQRGQDIGKKLTPQTRSALREFRTLSPTQQELMRVSFENQMASDALGVRRGRAAADQFNSEAFDRIIETMYPRPRSASRGEARAAEQAVFDRGQALRRNLRREAISTETTRDVLSGSRTAALSDDMAELMEGPRAAADAITGRWTKLLENLSNRLTREIGKRAAQERVRILTETDPAQMLPMLDRLAREASSAGEREAYQEMLRQFAYVGRRGAADVGAVTTSTTQE